MAWFIEKTMRFRFKFSDFHLYINILTIFKFQNGRLSLTMTQATLPGLLVIYPTVAFVQESSATLSILTISGCLFASIFVELEITTLGAGELRHLTGMNMLYFTSHTFCSNGGRFGHLIKQVLSPIDMWLALIRCSSCRWTSPILDF